jgi:hypothetical protein
VAFREVAQLASTARSPLAGSAYADRLTHRIAHLPASTVARAESAREALFRHCATTEFDFGRWHGDWTPWNMGWAGSRVILWDWERTAAPVPVGFDALHYWFQPRFIHSQRRSFEDLAASLHDAHRHLDELEVARCARPVLAAVYLLDLFTRLSASAPDATGPYVELIDSVGTIMATAVRQLT